jgi:hypothetical protein
MTTTDKYELFDIQDFGKGRLIMVSPGFDKVKDFYLHLRKESPELKLQIIRTKKEVVDMSDWE